MKLALAWLFAVAACDSVLGLTRTVAADANVDAVPQCTTALDVHDTFAPSATPCSSWGFVDMAMANVTADNALHIDPAPNVVNSRGGCVSSGTMIFEADTGVFVKVTTPPGPAEFQTLALQWDSGPHTTTIVWGTDVAVDTDGVQFAVAVFDPIGSPWVRVRPSIDRTQIVAELSDTTVTWKQFGAQTIAPPGAVKLFMYGGVCGAPCQPQASPQTIVYDALNTCP